MSDLDERRKRLFEFWEGAPEEEGIAQWPPAWIIAAALGAVMAIWGGLFGLMWWLFG